MSDGKYNFHSHTYRCGHASSLPDESYLIVAKRLGYSKYGVTDHVPVHPIFFGDKEVRMHDNEFLEYLESIYSLKQKYAGELEVFCGFEAEYDEIIEEYLCDLKDKCDYMILGQHYVLNRDIRNTPEYPIEYAKKVCRAIESGIFDIVAHPDIFMQYRFNMKIDEKKDLFYDNALKASRMICECAKEWGVALEINLGATYAKEDELVLVDGKPLMDLTPEEKAIYYCSKSRYPTDLFWEIVKEVGNDVVVGVDAHQPKDIYEVKERLEKIGMFIDLDSLHFLPDSYDPVKYRNNNEKLCLAYEKTRSNTSSVEGRLIESAFNNLDGDNTERINIILDSLKNPPKRKLEIDDNITIDRRNELIDVIKNSVKDISSDIDSSEYIDILKNDIDNYYTKEVKRRK